MDAKPPSPKRPFLIVFLFATVLFISLSISSVSSAPINESNSFQEVGTLNTGCDLNTVSGCDSRSYKQDLPTDKCDLQKNYLLRGNLHNVEEGTDGTDYCINSNTLREYYFHCDDHFSWGIWVDVTKYEDKDCSTLGSNYVCENGACIQKCTAGYTGNKRCASGNIVEKEYKNSDCSLRWVSIEDCDNRDSTGPWGSNYCSNGDVYHSRAIEDFSCYSGECQGQSRQEEQLVQDCNDITQTCSGGQCVARTCTPQYTGNTRCGSGQTVEKEWRNSDCSLTWKYSEDCNTQDKTGDWGAPYCRSGNVYHSRAIEDFSCTSGACYGQSRADEQLVQDCAASNEGCLDGACVPRGCAEFPNTDGSCIWLTNTQCGDDGNPYECRAMGSSIWNGYLPWCYQKIETCTTEQYCEDPPSLTAGADCFDYQCELQSVTWDSTSAKAGDRIGITAIGSHCNSSHTAYFEVRENDGWLGTNNVTVQPASSKFLNNIARTSWVAEYQTDGVGGILGDPEYLTYGIVNGKKTTSSNELSVSCTDNDGDGFKLGGGDCGAIDCDDSNPTIHPGATEVCNGKDDDCDGSVDETFDKTSDNNNCGTCGHACSVGFTCSNSICKGCGDGVCEGAETSANCPKDCYGDLKVLQITRAPSVVSEGAAVTIEASVKNTGTYRDTLSLEASIVPDSWLGSVLNNKAAFDLTAQSIITPISQCCIRNNFYDAVNITLNAGETGTVRFDLYAPRKNSVDACNGWGSAWSTNNEIVVGLYKKCNDRYIQSVTQNIAVAGTCTRNSDCPAAQSCNFDSGYPGYCSGISTTHPKTKIFIDWSDGTIVNKQPGDTLKVRLGYVQTEDIKLIYNADILTNTDCSDNFIISSDKVCTFGLDSETPEDKYSVEIEGGNKAEFKVMSEPSTIIITDRSKLIERFGNDRIGEVNSLLAQTYRNALSEGAVVYDLRDYLSGDIWTSLGEYSGEAYAVK